MFRFIIGSSLKYRFLVVAVAVAMVAYGMDQLRKMPIDVFPEFAPPLVEIQTEGPGMSAEEIEELITIPLEQTLRNVPGLAVLRSSTVGALSMVRMIFKPGSDLLLARQRVQERLALAIPNLPLSAGMPVILQPLSSTSRTLKIGITSKNMDLMDLSMIAYWTIRFRLIGVPGVANIPIWGDRIKALQVQVDPARLRAQDVTVDQVLEAASEALDFGLVRYTSAAKTRIDGFIDTPNQRLVIQHVLPGHTPEELANVPIKLKNGKSLRIGDVANVVWGTWPMVGDGIVNDGPGLFMIVEKLPWANTLEVTRGVEAALAELKPGLPGIEIDAKIFRPATFIELSISNLTKALLIGSALVVLVLGAFLFEWRVILISLVAIPLSLMAALLVLQWQGAIINTMVLAGFVVALGSIVDDAIIDIENIVRRLRQHRKEGSSKSTAAIILESSLEIRSAIVYATMIVVLAVTPVFFMGGLAGSFFAPLALSYALAELASLVVALTVTPALALILLRNAKAIEHRESPLVPWLKRGYDVLLARTLRAPRTTYAAAGVMTVAGLSLWPLLGQSLLPSFKERDFLMHWVTIPGSSHPENVRISVRGCKELLTIPGVLNCGSHIGRAIGGDEPYGVNFTEHWISIDPKVDYDKTLHAVEEVVDGYPGIYRDVQTYLRERIKEVLTGKSESIVVRIFGPELPVLRSVAEEVRQALSGIEGLIDLHAELQKEIPQIEVKVDLAAAARVGLKPGDVRRAASIIMSGVEVSDIHKDGKVYDVWVWSVPEARTSLTTLRELLIDTPDGGRVRLSEVADVSVKPAPNVIKREDFSRRIDVAANVRGRDLGSVAADVERRLQQVKFPLGYYPQMLGEYAERQAAQKRLLGVTVIAVVAIFLLLQVSYGSWSLACITFSLLPAAMVGGVLAAYLGGGVISLGSLVGFLTVLGIAARNGILLIHHYQHLERHEGEPFGVGLVMRGASERLSPILMTALCAGLALLPLVISGDLPGHEIEHPMAVVIVGGLVTSTLLNLFVVPALYLRYGGRRPIAALQPAAA
jgi:CzcA family heavy metal efflux pump